MYYVYALIDISKKVKYSFNYKNYKIELNCEPFYIGKGTKNRIKNTIHYNNSDFKNNKIRKLGNNMESIILINGLTNEEAISLEIDLIFKIGRRDKKSGPLVNLTDGGDGRLKSPHSEETKLKISKSLKGKYVGFKHTEETKLKMSISQRFDKNGFYNKTHTEETKHLQSIKVRGNNHPFFNKTHTKETKEKIRKKRKNLSSYTLKQVCQKFNKPVLMYNLNLHFMREFESVKKASEETKINESIISKCCRGDILNPTRYFFKYKNGEDNIKNNKFLIKVGSIFNYDKKKYKLIKRNKKTCICENLNSDQLENIHINDFKYIFEKEYNISPLIEIYSFIKNISINPQEIKIDKEKKIIYNNDIIIYYLNLLESSEIFLDRYDIYNRKNEDRKVIQIFEDVWLDKKNIIKSRLLNLFNKSKKIYARKCEIREIKDNKLIRSFLNDNHTQGFVGSRIKIGLFHDNKLISLMTFGNLRKNLGQKSKIGSYEMLRFCSNLNTVVVGGASKLIKYFIREYDPLYISSYADRRWSDGNMYETIGFKKSTNKTTPNYFYIVDNKRYNRFMFRKDILVSMGFDSNMTEVQIQHKRGYYRIFDCGSLKYEYFKTI